MTLTRFIVTISVVTLLVTINYLAPTYEVNVEKQDEGSVHEPADYLEILEKLSLVSTKTLEQLHRQLDQEDSTSQYPVTNLPMLVKPTDHKKHGSLKGVQDVGKVAENVEVALLKPLFWVDSKVNGDVYSDEVPLNGVVVSLAQNFGTEPVTISLDLYLLQGEAVVYLKDHSTVVEIGGNTSKETVLTFTNGPLVEKVKSYHAVLVRCRLVDGQREGVWLKNYNSVAFVNHLN
ncbi:hypothetical protein P9112_001871 [Eukaryota sp. TZLM1-RC]